MQYRVTVTDLDGTVVETFTTGDFDDGVLTESPMYQAKAALGNALDMARIGMTGNEGE